MSKSISAYERPLIAIFQKGILWFCLRGCCGSWLQTLTSLGWGTGYRSLLKHNWSKMNSYHFWPLRGFKSISRTVRHLKWGKERISKNLDIGKLSSERPMRKLFRDLLPDEVPLMIHSIWAPLLIYFWDILWHPDSEFLLCLLYSQAAFVGLQAVPVLQLTEMISIGVKMARGWRDGDKLVQLPWFRRMPGPWEPRLWRHCLKNPRRFMCTVWCLMSCCKALRFVCLVLDFVFFSRKQVGTVNVLALDCEGVEAQHRDKSTTGRHPTLFHPDPSCTQMIYSGHDCAILKGLMDACKNRREWWALSTPVAALSSFPICLIQLWKAKHIQSLIKPRLRFVQYW